MSELTILVIFILGTIGFTHIMVDSTIMEPFRQWVKKEPEPIPTSLPDPSFTEQVSQWFWKKTGQMLDCHQCAGFWCGIISGIILFDFGFIILFAGFASSFLSSWSANYLAYLEAKTIIEIRDEH